MDSEFDKPRIEDSEDLHASKAVDGSTRTVIFWIIACIASIVGIIFFSKLT